MIHTGQHFDPGMSDIFFEELRIPKPAYRLGIHGGSHADMTGRMLQSIEQVIVEVDPAVVIVYGDTNSTLAGALAASKLGARVAHVEAGLRSFNRSMPEEINRVVADHLSDLLFCPTNTAVQNLTREGITRNAHHVGDVMYDATLFAASMGRQRSSVADQLGLTPGKYGIATLHRASNTDDAAALGRAIAYLEAAAKLQTIIFPVHPRTRIAMAKASLVPTNLRLIEPVGYFDMQRLLADAAVLFTDSGGLQKEAYFHRIPCVTLRDETEWLETIECGWNRLWNVEKYRERKEIADYGDGTAAERVVDHIDRELRTAP
jgi:UDP-GlcNAc3NAcA epimerase